jgi:hypothetical protein
MLVGEASGKLWHLEQTTGDEFAIISREFSNIDVQSEAMPVLTYVDDDDLIDLIIGSNDQVEWYEQESPGSYQFNLNNNRLLLVDTGAHMAPALADINNDGLVDMLVGESLGTLSHFIQDDLYSETFTQVSDNFAAIDIGQSARPHLFDIDDDDKLDLFVGEWYKGLFHYEQADTGSTDFVLVNDEVLGVRDFGATGGYTIEDIDGDGLLDMLVVEHNGESDEFLIRYEQEGVNSENFLHISDDLGNAYSNTELLPRFADVNLDGRTDLFIGDKSGGIKLYLHGEDDDAFPPDIPTNLFANTNGNFVDLTWSSSSAQDLMLYNIYRSTRNDTVVSEYINSITADKTTYSDSSLTESGKYYYWITALDSVGNESGFSQSDSIDIIINAVKEISGTIARQYVLNQNYPNPFNPTTATSDVELSIYNQLGQKVSVLVSKRHPAGSYKVEWDASELASGIYYYTIQAGEFRAVRKMILLR